MLAQLPLTSTFSINSSGENEDSASKTSFTLIVWAFKLGNSKLSKKNINKRFLARVLFDFI